MLGWGGSARAQETNLALYEAVALQCLAAVPDTARAFVLEAPETMPYLRTALVNRWQAEGRTVFLPGAPGAGGLPGLRYTVETARVAYQKANGGRLARSVTLALRYTFSGADGRLLREARCQDTRTDVIPREALPRVETEAFPETRAEPPAPGWLRRYLEPVVITAATAVGIYLFFTLRSERADDGG
ncbi:hypothetical protein GQ464_012285 [Rhodocaloribacter litoris]|uniref:hypothetical protein n=1 Tax=Rhodocaloribacter litoris TaxID=2558931 RepID=UPI001423CB7A|nr:hypothetical protein [Rhodocaloribacter litoris]QXD14225.1 hypothetical protein GQ464_012285 [Rhodocaloribacter litoris]